MQKSQQPLKMQQVHTYVRYSRSVKIKEQQNVVKEKHKIAARMQNRTGNTKQQERGKKIQRLCRDNAFSRGVKPRLQNKPRTMRQMHEKKWHTVSTVVTFMIV